MVTKRLTETCSRIFAKPALMLGEDPADYEAMRDLIVADIDQDDVHECLHARDIVDSEWEVLRLRGMKPGILHAAITRVLNSITVEEDLEWPDDEWRMVLRRNLVGALSGDPHTCQQLKQLLSRQNLTFELVTGAAFESTLRPQVDTDRMIGAALDRRRAAYRDLDECRSRKREKLRCETEGQAPGANGPTTRPTVAPNTSAGKGR